MTRSANIHTARVYLAQSRHFTRQHRGFSFVLLEWAANCRRRIAVERSEPQAQLDLFGTNLPEMAITRRAA
jgi:hypothetical protein